MAPVVRIRIELVNRPAVASATAGLSWVNKASRRHCHFGLKSAPQHRDFRPEKEEVN
jgi:hypothetical protein